MSVTNSVGMLSSNLEDLEKSLSILADKLAPVLLPETAQAMLLEKPIDSAPSALSQDILRLAGVINDLNIKCSNLISRMDIL